MSVDRTFPHDAEPLVFEEQKAPASARKIRPLWYKRLKRIVADIAGLEDSIAALPDNQTDVLHPNSSTLTDATLNLDVSIPRQRITNTGAFTVVAPTTNGSCCLLITNGVGSGTITLSGFNTEAAYRGATLTSTSSHWFLLRVDRISGISLVKITQEAD